MLKKRTLTLAVILAALMMFNLVVYSSDTLYKSTSIKGVHKWDAPGTRFHVYARVKAEAWRDIEFKDTWLLEKTVPS